MREEQALVASALSELVPGSDVFRPTTTFSRADGRISLTGVKRPCTMSTFARYFAVTCVEQGREDVLRIAVVERPAAAIPGDPPETGGIDVDRGYFKAPYFAAAESHALHFRAFAADEESISVETGDLTLLLLLNYGMQIFNVAVAACYSGVVDALFARLERSLRQDEDLAYHAALFRRSSASLIGAMVNATGRGPTEDAVVDVLSLRYALQRHVHDLMNLCNARLDAPAVFGDQDVGYLINTARMMKHHPMTERRFVSELIAAGA